MRILIRLVVIVAVLWTGAWFLAARGIDRAVAGWLDDRRSEGWQADATTTMGGFPTTLRLHLADPALADPETGLAWRAGWAGFTARPWAPTEISATLPPVQLLATPYGRVEITAATMAATLAVAPTPKLTVESMQARLADIRAIAEDGTRSTLASGRLDTIRVDDAPLTHDIAFEARDLTFAAPILSAIAPADLLPRTLSELSLDARAVFDAPWDIDAIAKRRPQPTAITLRRSRAKWGEMEVELAGSLEIDGTGIPTGEITLRAINWREMVRIGDATGLIPEGLAPTMERALEILAGFGGTPDTIDTPIYFRNGFVTLGPIPVGRAPRLRLR